MDDSVTVIVQGHHDNGTKYSDTIEITPEMYRHMLSLVQEEIDRREVKLGHRWRMHVGQSGVPNDQAYYDRHNWLIEIMCRLDI